MPETPFGFMGGSGPAAPTKDKVAANPGAFDGTAFDPTVWFVVPIAVERTTTLPTAPGVTTFAEYFRLDPAGAAALFAMSGQYGHPLNLDALTHNQRVRLGIKLDGHVTVEGLAKQIAVVQSQNAMLAAQNTAIMAALFPAVK